MITWIKNILKNRIYKPTPLLYRAIGDSMLFGLGGVSIEVLLQNKTELGITLIVVQMVGKFLSNIPIDNNKK